MEDWDTRVLSAGFWSRFLAVLIDSIVISAPFGILTYALGNGANPTIDSLSSLTSIFYTLLLPVYWNGYTVGKKLLRIRIVKVSGERISMRTMVMRNIICGLLYIFTLGIAVVVSAFMVAFRTDRRSVHDFIAGTYVEKC